MIDLKPCPYCGAGEATDNNNASFSGVELMAGGTDRPYVWCGTCCASARMADTEAEAIAAWNRRTDDPAAIREAALREAADAVSNLGREFADGGSPTAMKVLDLASDRILAALDLSPTPVDASQTPDPDTNDHQYSPSMNPNDAGDCRLCGASMSAHFVTSGAERRWIEDTEAGLYDDPVLSDPRVKALVAALRQGRMVISDRLAVSTQIDDALRAIGGEA